MKDESALLEELKELIGDENYVEVELETIEHGNIHSKRSKTAKKSLDRQK